MKQLRLWELNRQNQLLLQELKCLKSLLMKVRREIMSDFYFAVWKKMMSKEVRLLPSREVSLLIPNSREKFISLPKKKEAVIRHFLQVTDHNSILEQRT